MKFCSLVWLKGKSYKGNRKVTLPCFSILTYTGRSGSINNAAIEKIIKSSGKVAGFTSMRLKMRVKSS